jgi:hypothetical protein
MQTIHSVLQIEDTGIRVYDELHGLMRIELQDGRYAPIHLMEGLPCVVFRMPTADDSDLPEYEFTNLKWDPSSLDYCHEDDVDEGTDDDMPELTDLPGSYDSTETLTPVTSLEGDHRVRDALVDPEPEYAEHYMSEGYDLEVEATTLPTEDHVVREKVKLEMNLSLIWLKRYALQASQERDLISGYFWINKKLAIT